MNCSIIAKQINITVVTMEMISVSALVLIIFFFPFSLIALTWACVHTHTHTLKSKMCAQVNFFLLFIQYNISNSVFSEKHDVLIKSIIDFNVWFHYDPKITIAQKICVDCMWMRRINLTDICVNMNHCILQVFIILTCALDFLWM